MIWDSEDEPDLHIGNVVLWRKFSSVNSHKMVSIPSLVELFSAELREIYLNLIYEVGEAKLDNQRLVDYFQIRPGLSAWWMSLISEKSNFSKSPEIEDVIRIFAFEKWVSERNPKSITLVSSNEKLIKCIRSWCLKKNIKLLLNPVINKKHSGLLRSAFKRLPYFFQAIFWNVRYIIERWPLRKIDKTTWRKSKGKVTFVSYFDNLVVSSKENGEFESNYWSILPDKLKAMDQYSNWLHLYVNDSCFQSSKSTVDFVNVLNDKESLYRNHMILDTFLDTKVLLLSLLDWLKIRKLSKKAVKYLHLEYNQFDLWPFFKDDWNETFLGRTSLSTALNYNLFCAAFRILPVQSMGLYLQENQGWERGMIHAWNVSQHRHLVGVPHSTIRYWDMRYYFDKRVYEDKTKNMMPKPEVVAVNGDAARNELSGNNDLHSRIIKVEALRYLHLANKGKNTKISNNNKLRLLVLGDYENSNTEYQLKMLESAVLMLETEVDIIVKPHPNCPVRPTKYPGMSFSLECRPIVELLDECNFAFVSSGTSAALDVYCSGLPVIIAMDPATLNLSPLRSQIGAMFVSTPTELKEKIELINELKYSPAGQNVSDYFEIDPDLPRWERLINDLLHAT